QCDPQPAPGAELFVVREQKLHLVRGIPGGEGGDITVVRHRFTSFFLVRNGAYKSISGGGETERILAEAFPFLGKPPGCRFPKSLSCKGRWLCRRAQPEGGGTLPDRYPAG